MSTSGRKKLFSAEHREALYCEYFVLLSGNGTDAAMRAGYSQNRQSASKASVDLLQKKHIKDKIIELFAEKRNKIGVTSDDLLIELKERTFIDPREMFDEFGMLKQLQALPGHLARAVQSYKVYETSQGDLIKDVRFVDKTKHMEMFMKHLGMLQERIKLDIDRSEVYCFVVPDVKKFELPDDDPILTTKKGEQDGKVLFSNVG